MGRPDCEVTGVPYEQLHVLGSQIRSCGYWAGHVLRSDAGSMLLRMAVRKDSMSSLAGTGRLVPDTPAPPGRGPGWPRPAQHGPTAVGGASPANQALRPGAQDRKSTRLN